MKNCEHKYKVWDYSPESYLIEIRNHFRNNNSFLAAIEVEKYFNRKSIQHEVDAAIDFTKNGSCQVCNDPFKKGE